MQTASSLKQVSNILGVSTATVSNAFNRPDQLSSKLREHILSECQRLGYSGPSLAARSLRSGKSDVIGVMLSDSLGYSFADPMANQLMEGISNVLADNAKQLLLLSAMSTSEAQVRAESLPDGFIFYGTPRGDSFERIIKLGKPCVTVDFTYGCLPSLNIDNYGASSDLAKEAIKSTNDVVGVIGMHFLSVQAIKRLKKQDLTLHTHEVSWRRLVGYTAGAGDKGVQIQPDNIIHIHRNKIEEAEIAARMLLMQEKRPTVIFCMSDVIAIAVTRVAKSLKIDIPDMLRVTGFDNIEESQRCSPPLTTVEQSGIEKGSIAAKMLLEQAQGQIMFPVHIVIRETT